MNLCVDTSRPPSPQPPQPPPKPETPTEKKKDVKRSSKRSSASFGDTPKSVERKNSNRMPRSDSITSIEKQSTRRNSTAAEPEMEPPAPPPPKTTTDKRWRIFGPAAFSEVLLRIAVEYLTFHGNPVQQRCSAYSKGLWLLTHLNNVFMEVAVNHKNRPVSPASTSFVRPLHSLIWDADGSELFRAYPKGKPLAASVTNPKIDDDDLSEDEYPEVASGYGNDSAVIEKAPSNNGSEKPGSGFGSRSTSSKGGTRSKSSRGGANQGLGNRQDRGNGQVSAAAATMRALDKKQREERLIEEARQKHARKVAHAAERRKEFWRTNWGSPHNWKTSVVDRYYIYPPKASVDQPYMKLIRRQSKTHTYLLTVEKWLSTMGPAQDYWMTPQQLEMGEKSKKSKLTQKTRGKK
jgi:hypothetical protein